MLAAVAARGEGLCPPIAHIAKPAMYAPPAEASALSSQIQEAFAKAGWAIRPSIIGSLNVTVLGSGGGGRVDIEGLYLIAPHPENPVVRLIVSAFEQARHPVSLNGSTVLEPLGEVTLYVIFGNRPVQLLAASAALCAAMHYSAAFF
jgi:hypothetical protein